MSFLFFFFFTHNNNSGTLFTIHNLLDIYLQYPSSLEHDSQFVYPHYVLYIETCNTLSIHRHIHEASPTIPFSRSLYENTVSYMTPTRLVSYRAWGNHQAIILVDRNPKLDDTQLDPSIAPCCVVSTVGSPHQNQSYP